MSGEFKSFYKTVGGNEGGKCKYNTRLDTYGKGCNHDCSYCVDPNTLVLMYDGTHKKIKDIEIGDGIYGVREGERYKELCKSTVLNKISSIRNDVYKITLYDGTELICSGEHRWLSNRGWKYTTDEKNQRPYLTGKDSILGIKNYNTYPKELDNEGKTIKSIEPVEGEFLMYDITTSTENFIANGCVSHNCYAKSLLSFRGMWDSESPAVADIDKIRKTIKNIKKKGEVPIVRLGGMTDCFQPIEVNEKVTYETIKCLNENRIEYLIVTKSDLVASDEYINILDKDLAHIQITVTTTDDELSKTYEKAVVPSRRIKAIEKLQERGFDVALRLSPFIDEYIDYDILNSVKCDKIQVEFLRVNSWIEKWFDIDYSNFTVKQSNYKHLPLEKKKELISKITGFKYVSVCEDESDAYEYWKNNFNPNPDDCCNLRR